MATTPTPPRLKRSKDGRAKWRSRWYDDKGKRRDKVFGFADEVGEREVRQLYKQWLTEWTQHNHVRNPEATENTYTATQLAIDYLCHAKKTFVKNGEHTSYVWKVAGAMQALIDGFAETPIAQIEYPDLAKLLDAMVWTTDQKGERVALGLKTVNERLYIIKVAYKWARKHGLVSAAALADVLAVDPLNSRSEAKPPKKIEPVNEHWVNVAKKYLASPVAAMVSLQWITGMRPGEVCILRPCDIDMTMDVWAYTPWTHKMEHKGKDRVIFFGSRCQEIIRPFLARPMDAYCFSPAEAVAERMAAKRETRKAPVYPSSMQRRDGSTGRAGDHYTTETYRRAIHYACLKARDHEEEHNHPPTWNPNQLRHAAATRLNREYSLEDVGVTLGHSDISTTRRYAQPDCQRAIEIARKAG